MQSVVIIGAGEIGATTALALARLECAREIRLVGASGTVAAGKALDILQSGPIEGVDVRVSGSTDVTAAAGAAAVVIADRETADGEWRDDAGLDLVRRVVQIAPHAPIVFAGAGQRGVLALAHRELRVPRERLIGSAPGALVSAARGMVAVGADCSADDVALAVVGRARVLDPRLERVHRGGRAHHGGAASPRAGADGPAHAGELAAWPIRAGLRGRAMRRGDSPQRPPAPHGFCGARGRVRRPASRRRGAGDARRSRGSDPFTRLPSAPASASRWTPHCSEVSTLDLSQADPDVEPLDLQWPGPAAL